MKAPPVAVLTSARFAADAGNVAPEGSNPMRQ
jgi:hypothetical protein